MINQLSTTLDESPKAVIIVKDHGYKQLVNSLSRQLAIGGCNVKTTDNVDPSGLQHTPYIILVGAPSGQDLTTLNSFIHKLVVVARASELSKLKQDLKLIPSYFLSNNYIQDLSAASDEILEILMTQKPHKPLVKKRIAPDLTHILHTKTAQSISKKTNITPEAIVTQQYHLPISPGVLKIALVFLIPLVIAVFFTIYLSTLIISTKTDLIAAVSSLQAAQFEKAQTNLIQSQQNMIQLERIYAIAQPAVRLVSSETNLTIVQFFSLGKTANDTLLKLNDTGIRSQDFVIKLLQKQPQPIAPFSAYLEEQLMELEQDLIIFRKQHLELRELNTNLSNKLLANTDNFEQTIDATLKILPSLRQIAPTLPELFADNDRKKYLLLFQNNMELRPTGGFIGSVGFLSFENGKMLEIAIDDVYNLDGQLEGHVDPPEPIRNYLKQPNWFLRDANWHPDYTRSAAQIQWFLDKEVNTKVDGVFAIDLEATRYLLSAIGGIHLSDFDIFINEDNLYLEVQNTSEEEFFPGATNKRDILGSLARNLLLEISTRDDLNFSTLTKAIYQSLSEKHILVAFNEPTLQSAFNSTGWTGRLLQPSCLSSKDTSCIPDYLMLVEANLGANKVNYFTEGNIIIEVKLDKNRLRRTVTVNTRNNSNSHEFPGGTYKNYLRILTPPDVVLDQVILNSTSLDLAGINRESLGQYQSWGLYLEVAPGNNSTLKFSYSSSYAAQQPTTYELMIQKQPGSKQTPLTFNFEADNNQRLEPINFNSIPSGTSQAPLAPDVSLLYNTNLNTDKVLSIKIQ